MSIIDFVSEFLSFLTLVGSLIIVFYFGYLAYGKKTGKYWKPFEQVLKRYGLIFALLVSAISTAGSLFYSEIAMYNPCKLCWYQRIFMYPQVVLTGIAVYKNYKEEIVYYISGLSLIGAILSGYHYYLQRWGGSDIPCSAVGYSEACAQNFVLDYGYITIPMMALTAFILIILFTANTTISSAER